MSKDPLKRMLESAHVSSSILLTSPVPIFAEITKGASFAEVPYWQSSGENVIALLVMIVGVWFLTARTLRFFFSADFDFSGLSLLVMTLTTMVGSVSGLSRGACLCVLGLRPSLSGDLSLSVRFDSLMILANSESLPSRMACSRASFKSMQCCVLCPYPRW